MGFVRWGKEKEGLVEVRVIERVQAHYEVLNVEIGKVYRWCPERVVVECGCGEEPTLTASRTICGGCGADHAAFVGEVLEARPAEEEGIEHPWRLLLRPYYLPTRGLKGGGHETRMRCPLEEKGLWKSAG